MYYKIKNACMTASESMKRFMPLFKAQPSDLNRRLARNGVVRTISVIVIINSFLHSSDTRRGKVKKKK